jgi:ribonuclease R
MNGQKDPYANREAKKYTNPIPSREYILQLLHDLGKPTTYDALTKALKLTEPEQLEALRRRLKAMVRDGQLMPNRNGAYGLVKRMQLIPGRIQAHKDGYGFLIPDEGGDDLFLSAKQMRRVFHGDRVLAAVIGKDFKGRKEGRIAEVIERNTQDVVGFLCKERGAYFVQPAGKQFTHDIGIAADKILGAEPGQIVQAKIISQPGKLRGAVGEITEVLGEHMAPGMEINIAIRSYQLPHKWPEQVEAETREFSQEVPADAKQQRKDLRDLPLITIDGEDAKDFDDAVYCEPRDKGGWRLYVAIADVSHYVKIGSALDVEAEQRGNSVYFPGRVVPMLPEILSNGLCSLNPKVDRLCLVCDMTISDNGKITRSHFYSAVMHSKARMTYTNVDKILKGDLKLGKQYKDIKPHLQNLYDLFQALFTARTKRGALEFDSTDTKIIFGRDKKIERIVATHRNDAHRIIEECMLAANVSAAECLLKNKLTALYRVHPAPSEEKLADVRKFLNDFNLQLQGGNEPQPSDYAKLLAEIAKRQDSYLIQTVLLRSLKQAIYTADNEGHFGLGYNAYTHFTSPIRRYPDLITHRALKHIVEHADYPYQNNEIKGLGEHCSYTERRADDATRDVTDWLKCEYMQDKCGKQFSGIISGVTNFGIFILLDEVYVEGLVHISNLAGDYYVYDSAQHTLTGENTQKVYRMGDKLTVKVMRVNLDDRQIDFELA